MRDRRIRVAIAMIALSALLAACQWGPGEADEPKTGPGSLRVNINRGDARGITEEPPLSMTVAEYQVRIQGPGPTQEQTIPASQTSAAFEQLEPGDWTVDVFAWNDETSSVVIASGTQTVEVLSLQVTTIGIPVVPLSGDGTVSLTITWPDGLLVNPGVGVSLNGQDISGAFVVDTTGNPDAATYTELWPAGYYELVVSLTDSDTPGGTATKVWGDASAIRVIEGYTTAGQFDLTADQINAWGEIGVTIEPDLQNPYTVTLSGAVATITDAETMTVTAAVDPNDPPDSYRWYLDGVSVLEGATASSITIGPSPNVPAAVGAHELSVLVTHGSVISSNGVSFTVEAATTP